MRNALFLAVFVLMLLSPAVSVLPSVYAAGPYTIAADQNPTYHNGDVSITGSFVTDRYGELGVFSWDPPFSTGGNTFRYSNDRGVTWIKDATVTGVVNRAEVPASGSFSPDGNNFIVVWNDFVNAPTDVARVSRFSVQRGAGSAIVGFTFLNTTVITGTLFAGNAAIVPNPDDSASALVLASDSGGHACYFQTPYATSSFKSIAGVASAINCETTWQYNTGPSMITHPSSKALMIATMDGHFAPSANVLIVMAHVSSSVWDFAGRSGVISAAGCAVSALGCADNYNGGAVYVDDANTAWYARFVNATGPASYHGKVHLSTLSGAGVVTDASVMDCTTVCFVQGGLAVLSLQAGWTGVVANSKIGTSCPCPLQDDQVTFAAGPRRTYVFFGSTYGGNQQQTGYFYWDGSSNSALTVFQQGGVGTQWVPVNSAAIAPPVIPAICSSSTPGIVGASSMVVLIAVTLVAGVIMTMTRRNIVVDNRAELTVAQEIKVGIVLLFVAALMFLIVLAVLSIFGGC